MPSVKKIAHPAMEEAEKIFSPRAAEPTAASPKPTESAVKHTAMEAGMHDAAQEKAAAKKPAKKMAKHGRPSHTEIEHLEEGGHIIHHRFAHKKGGKSAEPEMQSKHIATDDAGLQAHMAQMLSQPAPAEPDGAAPMTPPPAAPDAAAAQPQPAPQQ